MTIFNCPGRLVKGYLHRVGPGDETGGGAVVFTSEHGGRLRTGLAVLLPLESGGGARVWAGRLLGGLIANSRNIQSNFIIGFT